MEDFVFKVRPEGEDWFVTEFELAENPYSTTFIDLPAGWGEDLPLSAFMDSHYVPSGSVFVAADSRSGVGDSRTWGSLDLNTVRGKVLFRYWPFSRFGRLQ